MYKTQIINLQIDIKDPISFSRRQDSLIERLSARYVGKCLSDCIVSSIDEIVERSPLLVAHHDARVYQVQARVLITGLIMPAGSVLAGVRVDRLTSQHLAICSTAYADIMVNDMSDALRVVKAGNLIPVRVSDVVYKQMSKTASAVCTMYTHNTKVVLYPASKEAITSPAIDEALVMMRREEEACAPLRASRAWKFFSTIFDPYDGREKKTKSPTSILLEKYLKEGSKARYIGRDARCASPTDTITLAELDQAREGDTVRTGYSHENAVVDMICDYIADLALVRQSCTIYSTDDLLKAHGQIFQYYASSRTKLA